MAFKLTKVRCHAQKDQFSYRVFGVMRYDDFKLPLALTLHKEGARTDVFVRVDCIRENERSLFDQLSGFAIFRNARLACIAHPRFPKLSCFRLAFSLAPRNRTFRECLSVVEESIKNIDRTLSVIIN